MIENNTAIWHSSDSRLTTDRQSHLLNRKKQLMTKQSKKPVWKGLFIAIEGTDGSGKETQSKLVAKMLRKQKYPVTEFDFPRYKEPSSWFVTQYLNGKFGTLAEIGAQKASLFFALDRYAASKKITAAIRTGRYIVSNRFVASNLAHQGSKMDNDAERRDFMNWAEELEFKILGIPKPDCNIILFVTPEISQQLVDRKKERKHLKGKKRDLHEQSIDHLTKTYNVYRELVQRNPRAYLIVECVEDGKLLPIPVIFERIWKKVKQVIAS